MPSKIVEFPARPRRARSSAERAAARRAAIAAFLREVEKLRRSTLRRRTGKSPAAEPGTPVVIVIVSPPY